MLIILLIIRSNIPRVYVSELVIIRVLESKQLLFSIYCLFFFFFVEDENIDGNKYK